MNILIVSGLKRWFYNLCDNGYLYALTGNSHRGLVFARYNISTDTWESLNFNPSWSATDDGASLAAIGDLIYALKGEVDETTPNGDFASAIRIQSSPSTNCFRLI